MGHCAHVPVVKSQVVGESIMIRLGEVKRQEKCFLRKLLIAVKNTVL